jgi:hypothetical protein
MVGLIWSGRAKAGLGDGRGDAENPGERISSTDDHTNDSAGSFVGADPPRLLHRSHSPASQASADHRMAVGVNCDASLFYRATGSDLGARHDDVAPTDYFGSAVRRTGPRGAGPAARNLQRNRFARGRSSYRSPPACDSPRRETAAPTPPRYETAEHPVDLCDVCRDVCPACVPSTVRGTASSLTAKFRSRRRACPSRKASLTQQRRRVSLQSMSPDSRNPTKRTPSRTSYARNLEPGVMPAVRYLAPDTRGFRQPSTPPRVAALAHLRGRPCTSSQTELLTALHDDAGDLLRKRVIRHSKDQKPRGSPGAYSGCHIPGRDPGRPIIHYHQD